MLFFFAFIVSLVVTMTLIAPLRRVASRLRIVDLPNSRKIHSETVPRIGGIAIVIGAIVPIFLWLPLERNITALLLAIGVLLVFGVWDDRNNLDYRLKFLGQFIAVLLVVLYGGVVIDRMPFTETLPGYVSIPLTVFALIGITNAINLADGLDGLAGGTMLLSLGTIALLAYLANGFVVVLVSLAVMGAILGFLRHNTYPARLFMGDTGSQFLGFSVGVLVVILTQQTNPALSPALPIMILGLPILDTFAVMGQRLYEGRSPFSPDRNHIHHKLLALGFDHYESVILIYMAQAVLVMASYFLRYESDALILGSYGGFCLVILGGFYLMQVKGWSFADHRKKESSYIFASVQWLRRVGLLSKAPYKLIEIMVVVFLFAGVLLPSEIPKDMGLMAIILLLAMLLALLWLPFVSSLIEKAGVYIASVIAVYLMQSTPELLNNYSSYITAFFIILALAVAIHIRFSHDKTFQVTTLDFLVIFIAVTVPKLPDLPLQGVSLSEIVVKLIILFYASEVILSAKARHWDILRWGTLAALGVISIRGLLGNDLIGN